MNAKQKEQQEYADKLREFIKPGDTVYTILRHVSRSGMQRVISLVVMRDGQPWDISGWAARALGDRTDKNGEGIVVGGCGMDMGFHIVYNLSYVLFPDGFKVEGMGRNGDMSGWDKDGGYALKQRWL